MLPEWTLCLWLYDRQTAGRVRDDTYVRDKKKKEEKMQMEAYIIYIIYIYLYIYTYILLCGQFVDALVDNCGCSVSVER